MVKLEKENTDSYSPDTTDCKNTVVNSNFMVKKQLSPINWAEEVEAAKKEEEKEVEKEAEVPLLDTSDLHLCYSVCRFDDLPTIPMLISKTRTGPTMS